MLLNYLPRHLLVLALYHNRILTHLHHCSEAASQLTCHYLSLLSLLEPDGGDHVLAFLLILELFDEVAVLGEGLQLDRKHGSFRFGEFVIAEGELDESAAGDVELAIGWQI